MANLLAVAIHAADHGWPIYTTHLSRTLHRHLLTHARFSDAETLHTRAITAAREMGDRPGELDALCGLGNTRQATGHPAEALTHHRAARELAHDLGQPTDQARALHGLAHAHKDLGQREHARELWQQALNILTDLDIPQVEEISIKEIQALLATIEPRTMSRAAGAGVSGFQGRHLGCFSGCCTSDPAGSIFLAPSSCREGP